MADLNINVHDTVTTLEAYRVTGISPGGRLWSSGAEQQQAGVNYELDASFSASISTSIFRSGAASYHCQATVGNTNIEKQFSANDMGNTVYSRGYVYFTAFPSSIATSVSNAHSDITIMDITSSDGSYCEVTIDASGVIRAYSDGNPRTLLGTTSAINLGQWYRLELAVSPNYRYVEARLDGVIIGSINNISGYEGFGGVNLALWGCGLLATESATVDMYWDDLAINEAAGNYQNSWPGSGKIINLPAASTGDNNAFTIQTGGIAGAANNYSRVNSVPQSDITYNGDTISGDIDDFGIQATGSYMTSGDTVNVVHVGNRYRIGAVNTGLTYGLRLKRIAAGTLLTSTIIKPINTTFSNYQYVPFTINPYSYGITAYLDPDGNSWYKSTIDSAQIGYQLIASGTEIDLSGMWLVVDYTPGTADLNINTSDTVTTSENSYAVPGDTNLNKSDTATTSESVTVSLVLQINVSDTVTTSETIQMEPPTSLIDDDPNDFVLANERLSIYIVQANTKYIVVNDDVTVSESSTVNAIAPAYAGPFGPLKFTVVAAPKSFKIVRQNT